MGTSCARSYAYLYLEGCERHITSDERYSSFLEHILLWHRYIDDLFLVWMGTRGMLLDFILLLNDFNLNFTFSFDDRQIPFLDLTNVKLMDGIFTANPWLATLYCMPLVLTHNH